MKQKDIALVVGVAIVSLILATVLSNLLFGGTGSSRSLTAEKVQPITADFDQPDKRYFNAESINPTETIRITTNANQTPFNQAQ